ncbi:putative tripartite motif-containing protein 16-like [Scophthalmus maximus]|uniref:Putative tripartite motif-containing protein 16-like n=1 Tax=Scophthalmus maximus TaxID=52904 RepID=A0A2U9BHP5_SCOMX|nr:putative tripartite motif-containing protein 16-like [Scophthalmus maximus]
MSHKEVEVERESISCTVCLDLLKDPVTIPCGHSYCMSCIETHWDLEDGSIGHSCPQCRRTFTLRPVLVKNIMLADLVEQLKKTSPADHCFAGAEDVACDVCTGRKLKADKSCLVCLVSYCEKHLKSHYDVPQLKKHKLVDPMKKLQEKICSRHDEVMKMFCRTDQQCICYVCSVEEHKGHDTVTAAAERTERQRELELSRQQIQQRVQDREKRLALVQQKEEVVRASVFKAESCVENISELLTTLSHQIRAQNRRELEHLEVVHHKLDDDITELEKKDAELNQFSHTEDHNQFLQNYPSLSPLSPPAHSSSIDLLPFRYFEDVRANFSEVSGRLKGVLTKLVNSVTLTVNQLDVSPSEPKTRSGLLQYSKEITLDPNTIRSGLSLSCNIRKVNVGVIDYEPYPDHPDRFTSQSQVLSRESLTGRCYWEVEYTAETVVAVAYKSIIRSGDSNVSGFGKQNDVSWALSCFRHSYNFYHKGVVTRIFGPVSSRVGVYLDHSAGVLSFYSVKRKMTLLHRVQTTFTQPLYAGVGVYEKDSTAEICSNSRSTNRL